MKKNKKLKPVSENLGIPDMEINPPIKERPKVVVNLSKKVRGNQMPVILPTLMEDEDPYVGLLDKDVDTRIFTGEGDFGIYQGSLKHEPGNVSIKYQIECKKDERQKNNRVCKLAFQICSGFGWGNVEFPASLPMTIPLKNGIKLKFCEFDVLRYPVFTKKSLSNNQNADNWNRKNKTISLIPSINDAKYPTFNSTMCVNKNTWALIMSSLNQDDKNKISKMEIGEIIYPDTKAEYDKQMDKLNEELKCNTDRPRLCKKENFKRVPQSEYKDCPDSSIEGGKVIAKINPIRRGELNLLNVTKESIAPIPQDNKITMLGENKSKKMVVNEPPIPCNIKQVIIPNSESASCLSEVKVEETAVPPIQDLESNIPKGQNSDLMVEIETLKIMVTKLQKSVDCLEALILLFAPSKRETK